MSFYICGVYEVPLTTSATCLTFCCEVTQSFILDQLYYENITLNAVLKYFIGRRLGSHLSLEAGVLPFCRMCCVGVNVSVMLILSVIPYVP